MLKDSTLQIIRDTLAELKAPVRLVLFTSDAGCDACPDAVATAQAIKAAAPKISLETYDLTMDRDKTEEYAVRRVPSFVVQSTARRSVTFSGSVEGVSLLLLLEAINGVASNREWFSGRIASTLTLLRQEVHVQVFLESDCTLCKPVAETAMGLALTNRMVSAELISADDFPDLLAKHRIKVLPYILFGSLLSHEGHASESEFLEMLFQAQGKSRGTEKRCVTCGQSSPDMICSSCKAKIQAEAVNHKSRDEHMHERGMFVENPGHKH
jgi:alkyl hydroperoxide reductase subunit AhpF